MKALSLSRCTTIVVLTVASLCQFNLLGKQRLIIIMQEGLGHELMNAARLYSENPDLWDWRLDSSWFMSSVSTLPLTTNGHPDGSDPDNRIKYDPLEAWNGGKESNQFPTNSLNQTCEGYRWLIENASDKNQAASAINSGIATYNTSTNWLPYPMKSGSPMPMENLMVEWAQRKGLKTGLISDMPLTHPSNMILGGLREESIERPFESFGKLIRAPYLNLYVAAGHPKYNELGQALSLPNYRFSTRNEWQDFRSEGRNLGWEVIFGDDNLMGVNNRSEDESDKRLVIMQFGDTTTTDAISTDASGLVNNLSNSIRFQMKTALSYLEKDENGFVLIIHLARLPHLLKNDLQKEAIGEVINTLQHLIVAEDWVEENGGWNETSLVLTSLYEYGLIWGSDSSSFPFSQISDRGKKKVPGFRINHQGPTATLTPLLVKGALAKRVPDYTEGKDPIYGAYLHLTSLNKLFRSIEVEAETSIEQP